MLEKIFKAAGVKVLFLESGRAHSLQDVVKKELNLGLLANRISRMIMPSGKGVDHERR